jgi:hypothetical protein
MGAEAATEPRRHVSPLLAAAIVAAPVLFTWLLLRKGYAGSTRRAAFLFMGMMVLPYPVVGVISAMMGG